MRLLRPVALLAAGIAGSGVVSGQIEKDSRPPSARGRLFFLDIRGGRVLSAAPDGSDVSVLVNGRRDLPDGIVVDVKGGHLFWTNMGRPMADDGSIERANLDGSGLAFVVPPGGTFTPKQLKLDDRHQHLYWSDREGMRIQRAGIDGLNIETIVETGHGDADRYDARRWCVGLALDVDRGKIYWSQKGPDDGGQGRILRANIQTPKGQTAADRRDIEVLFDGLPEPIDIDLDLRAHLMYWSDRGDLPRGNSVSRAPMDPPAGAGPLARTDQRVLVTGLKEGIGIALDVPNNRMFFTDLGGNVYSSRLDGSDKRTLLTGQGSLTGIAYAALSLR